jgi:hypothetical protein
MRVAAAPMRVGTSRDEHVAHAVRLIDEPAGRGRHSPPPPGARTTSPRPGGDAAKTRSLRTGGPESTAVRGARSVLPFAGKCRRIRTMTRLVIARLALRGELLCASRTSVAGLGQIALARGSRMLMTTSNTPPVASLAGTDFFGRAAATATPLTSVSSVTSVSSGVCPAGVSLQSSFVQSAPPAEQPRLAPQRLMSRLPRSLIVGGTPGPALFSAAPDCLILAKGGGLHREQ